MAPTVDFAQFISEITPEGGLSAGFKDLGIAYILLFFFAGIGVHKFYLGRVGMGILYIFTLGLFGIGTLVDIFTLGSQVRRANAEVSGRGY